MTRLSTSILIVRHGPGRGRFVRYGERTLHWIRRNDPALAQRIVVHETGSGAIPTVAAHSGAVVFWMADPLRELYPDCYAEASEIAELAARRGARMVNPPDALSNAIKSTQARLWEQADVPCAGGRRFARRSELEPLLDATVFPVIVRPDLLHAQQGMRVCGTRAEALAAADEVGAYPGALVPFVDTREGYRHGDSESVWAQCFHKKRAYVFGDAVIPAHIFFSSSPIVAWAGSTFSRYQGWGSLLQPLALFRRMDREAVAADLAFVRSVPEQPALMRRAASALGFESVALDYSTFADGRVVLWEANPHPSIPGWRHTGMPFARRTWVRLNRIYARTAEFFRSLIHESIDHRRTA
ncbi:MAG TPA: hypothetical protein VFM14_13475 [Gemmatimonadales bacterium]|nr:hypothetical protein [Gemmatimonadales bacterium]